MKTTRRIVTGVAGIVFISLLAGSFFPAQAPASPDISILYPKNRSIVGRKVNVVIDPTTDWSAVPLFQVVAGKTEYPVVDTSSGRHAVQGIDLVPGVNTITVRVLAPPPVPEGEKKAGKKDEPPRRSVVLTKSITIFNREESFGAVSPDYSAHFFHSREQEADCSGCHRLEVEKQDRDHKKPEDVLCYSCHRAIPKARNVHGPAAVWNCLSCHSAEIYPVKYQFTSANPWTVVKTTQPVAPAVFTIAADELFKPRSAQLISDDVPPVPKPKTKADKTKARELKKSRDEEIKKRKERERELFRGLLEHVKLNPGDKVRVEAHVDDALFAGEKGKKKKGAQELKNLTNDRARSISRLLASYGVKSKSGIVVAGMGASLPRVPNTTAENRILNNRIELVAHSSDVQVPNSMKLPLLADRERIIINVSYKSKTVSVKNLVVSENLPRGLQYVKGSGSFRGAVKDPQVKDDELRWQLGDPSGGYQETLSYVVKKTAGKDLSVSPAVRLSYTAGRQEETRVIDPLRPDKSGLTVTETCERCHSDIMAGSFRHGPVDSGYCNLCHDPHGSDHSAWIRVKSWELCTTCHKEKAADVHVIAGFVSGISHPTRNVPDPLRPGRKLSCISCHSPHSAETKYLLAFGVTREADLCGFCHKKK